MPIPFGWELLRSQKITIWSTSIQAGVLTLAFAAMLTNSLYGKKSLFVLLLSLAFIVSDIALALTVPLFRDTQTAVLYKQWQTALTNSVPLNVWAAIFAVFLCLPHWVFFYTYFECCITMPYFYAREKVPSLVRLSLRSLNVFMLSSSVIAPIIAFWAGNKMNVFFFTIVQQPGFDPVTADYSEGIKYSDMFNWWLNYVVAIQYLNGLILLVSIIKIKLIIRKHGYNKMVDQVSFVIHGALFFAYGLAVTFLLVWNNTGSNGLKELASAGFNLNPLNLLFDYEQWMRSYYQCLLLFSWANCLV